MVNYFWDSYAVIELIDGNKNYAKYVDEPIIITIFNLAEVYWFALNEYEDEKADYIYEKFKKCVVDVDYETLRSAIKFRKEHKKKNISYTDSIGYVCALKHNLRFLTGDKEFKDMTNVEFAQ